MYAIVEVSQPGVILSVQFPKNWSSHGDTPSSSSPVVDTAGETSVNPVSLAAACTLTQSLAATVGSTMCGWLWPGMITDSRNGARQHVLTVSALVVCATLPRHEERRSASAVSFR